MDYTGLLMETIGFPGRMISMSKSAYVDSKKTSVPIFNANICTKESGKIWFGDLDVTLDKEKLSALATGMGQDIYVLRELDARFENEEHPRLDQFVIVFKADGTWKLNESTVYFSMFNPETLEKNNNR